MVAHAYMPLIPAFGRCRQANLEFEGSLVYKSEFHNRTVTKRNPVSRGKKVYLGMLGLKVYTITPAPFQVECKKKYRT